MNKIKINFDKKILENKQQIAILEYDNKKIIPDDIDLLSENKLILNYDNVNTSSKTVSAYIFDISKKTLDLVNDDFSNLTEIEPNPFDKNDLLVRSERGLDDYWIKKLNLSTKNFTTLESYQVGDKKYKSHWFSKDKIAFLHDYAVETRGKNPIFTTAFKILNTNNRESNILFTLEDINKLSPNENAKILDFFVDKEENIYLLVDRVSNLNNTIHRVSLIKYNKNAVFSDILQLPTSNFERASILSTFND